MSLSSRIRQIQEKPTQLATAALVWTALILALLSLLSGPAQSLGIAPAVALDDENRVGRIIMLYHSLAVPFVAALVYLILGAVDVPAWTKRQVIPAITVGAVLTSAGGLTFAYLGRNWLFHGIFLVGLSLTFYAGVLLAIGLFPRRDSKDRLQRWAFWLMAVATLISAAIGAAIGSFMGNGFEATLAEDIVRLEHDVFQRGLIAHLHIMLTLIDVAILLLVARITSLTRRQSKWVYGLTIAGTIVVSLATWSVMIASVEKIAHKAINVGASFLLPAGILVAVQGLRQLLRRGSGRRLAGLFADPMQAGLYWFLLFVNLVVTLPGVYVAMHLETYRLPEYAAVERSIATGHWHVLGTLSAVMGFLLVARARQPYSRAAKISAWGLIVGSSAAFAFIQPYMFKAPGTEVLWPQPFFEAGIGIAMLSLGLYVVGEAVRAASRRRARTTEGAYERVA